MPKGMLLRSGWDATHIADPARALTLEAFQAASGNHFSKPVPLEQFVHYGQWYQRQALPDLDQREIISVEVGSGGFKVTLESGESFDSRRVIVAAGIHPFAWRPPELDDLDPSLASHTSEHRDLGRFSGRRVLVIGSGQSALESAALLFEAGADVEVAGRAHQIHWLQGWASTTLHWRLGTAVRNLLYAPTDVGPAGISQLAARPHLVRKLPRLLQDKLRKRAIRPAGSRWLVKRLEKVPIRLGRSIVSVAPVGERLKVRFDDGSERVADHVLLGTGYRVDVARYGFLAPSVIGSLQRCGGFPQLGPGFESSVRGLHFLGAPASWSYGPLMNFVSGTRFMGSHLACHIQNGSNTA